ncbi:MAG: response regulator [Inhella sp.]
MRALWIEDQQLIGDALELLLQLELPELTLDKARDLPTALQFAAAIPYELLLLDWWLGEQDGEQTLPALRKAGCQARVIVVSGDEREAVMRRAQALGAIGFVRKSAEPRELVDTLRAVLAGQRPSLPPAGAQRSRPPVLTLAALYPVLTPRQLEVFEHLLRGASDKQIARALGVGDSTVKTHVRVILQSLGVRSRGEAAHAAHAAQAALRDH